MSTDEVFQEEVILEMKLLLKKEKEKQRKQRREGGRREKERLKLIDYKKNGNSMSTLHCSETSHLNE